MFASWPGICCPYHPQWKHFRWQCYPPIHTRHWNNESGVTHMLHGYPGYHWTPTRRGGAPPHYAQCCKCVWCRGIHSALQAELASCPHICDAGGLSLRPGAPSAPVGQNRAREECTPAAWSLNPSCAAQEETRLVKSLATTMQHTHSHAHTHIHTDISLLFLYIKHTALLPACSSPCLFPVFLLLSLCLLPHTVLTLKSK